MAEPVSVKAAATTVANKVVAANWQAVFVKYSFVLGTLLALFLTFVAGHPSGMGFIHRFLPNLTDLEIAKYLNYAMLGAMFLKQGGAKKVVIAWDDLMKQADAQAIAYEPQAVGPPILSSTNLPAEKTVPGGPAP